MSWWPRARRGGFAAALAFGVLVVGPMTLTPASAVLAVESGVWWSGGPAPLPPSVPAGGTWVQQSASGQTATSAFRFAPGPSETPRAFFVQIHEPRGTPIGFSIKACMTTNVDWVAVQGGPLAAAPLPDCPAFETVGQESSGKLVFDLAGLPPRDTYSLVLVAGNVPVPALDPLFPVKPIAPYDVTFEKVSTTAVESTTVAEAPPEDEPAFEEGTTFFTPVDSDPPPFVESFEPKVPSFFDPIPTFAVPEIAAPAPSVSPRSSTSPAEVTATAVAASIPTIPPATGRSLARLAAGLAFVGLFLFGGAKSATPAVPGRALPGRASTRPPGRVSIYDWPPAPAARSQPVREGRPPALR